MEQRPPLRSAGLISYALHSVNDSLSPAPAMNLRTPFVVLGAALVLVAPLSAASAHPRLLKSTPAADGRTNSPPQQVTLSFNEALDLALTRVSLHHGEMAVRLDSLRLVAGDDNSVTATIVGTLAPGRYTVRWQVTGDDGHPVRGAFSFEVLAAAPGASRPERR